jgi:hypothetical protein
MSTNVGESDEWCEHIRVKIREWTEKHNHEKGKLVKVLDDVGILESYDDFKACHPRHNDVELRDLGSETIFLIHTCVSSKCTVSTALPSCRAGVN